MGCTLKKYSKCVSSKDVYIVSQKKFVNRILPFCDIIYFLKCVIKPKINTFYALLKMCTYILK